ncbi:uncharacterized protein LOC131606589 [Vicia villosa]|uniref:uncharacterized protein LOC131606589 n=1 Tax=Vicia villosa TaxID=3911 RepID=UPI00273C7000|nr:uncharacterized protein LOC131606589 [Vicia villosa]
MHTKQVSYRNDKTVLVKVYVEKPKKKRSSSIHQYHHHHHHYHIHHTVTQQVNDGSSRGYDRRSGLLMYSRLLRNSVRGGGSSPMPLLPNNSANNTIQQTNQLNSIKKQPKHGGTSSCFGNWKFLVPSFLLRSWSNEPKKEKKKQGISGNGFKKLQVSKGKGFIEKVFSTCK